MSLATKQVAVVPLAEIPARFGKALHVDGHHIAVFRLSTGEVRAVENRCPHRGYPLVDGIVSGEYLHCPMHDWKICLTDGQVQAPDTGCVQTYQTEIRGDWVYIFV